MRRIWFAVLVLAAVVPRLIAALRTRMVDYPGLAHEFRRLLPDVAERFGGVLLMDPLVRQPFHEGEIDGFDLGEQRVSLGVIEGRPESQDMLLTVFGEPPARFGLGHGHYSILQTLPCLSISARCCLLGKRPGLVPGTSSYLDPQVSQRPYSKPGCSRNSPQRGHAGWNFS